jgi:hypothetical protein
MSAIFIIQIVFILAALVCSALVSIRGAESFSLKTLYWMLAVSALGGGAVIHLMFTGVPL